VRSSRSAAAVAAEDPLALDETAAGRKLSARSIILMTLVVLLVAMFVPSINTGIRQIQQIAALEQDIEQTQHEVEQLQDKQKQLEDPEYIERVARQEQHYVRPGENAYIVVDDTEDDASASAQDKVERPVREQPWYIELLDSLKSVGYATKDSP
jgi:cell division protein FtsL